MTSGWVSGFGCGGTVSETRSRKGKLSLGPLWPRHGPTQGVGGATRVIVLVSKSKPESHLSLPYCRMAVAYIGCLCFEPWRVTTRSAQQQLVFRHYLPHMVGGSYCTSRMWLHLYRPRLISQWAAIICRILRAEKWLAYVRLWNSGKKVLKKNVLLVWLVDVRKMACGG